MNLESSTSGDQSRFCSLDDESVHIHPVTSLTKPRRLKETTAFDVYGAWLFTSDYRVALLVADELPQYFEDSGAILSGYISQVRNRAESQYVDCGDWIGLLQDAGEGHLEVETDNWKAFVMSFDTAVEYVLRNKDDYGLNPNATWYVV
jgi:hypothetical protein